jgi:hypothetical protein
MMTQPTIGNPMDEALHGDAIKATIERTILILF